MADSGPSIPPTKLAQRAVGRARHALMSDRADTRTFLDGIDALNALDEYLRGIALLEQDDQQEPTDA